MQASNQRDQHEELCPHLHPRRVVGATILPRRRKPDDNELVP